VKFSGCTCILWTTHLTRARFSPSRPCPCAMMIPMRHSPAHPCRGVTACYRLRAPDSFGKLRIGARRVIALHNSHDVMTTKKQFDPVAAHIASPAARALRKLFLEEICAQTGICVFSPASLCAISWVCRPHRAGLHLGHTSFCEAQTFSDLGHPQFFWSSEFHGDCWRSH